MTQQEQQHGVVPGPRGGEHDDGEVAVGTAHAPHAATPGTAAEAEDARYPGRTYSSEISDSSESHAAGAERDEALDGGRDGAFEADARRDEAAQADADYDEAVREHDARDGSVATGEATQAWDATAEDDDERSPVATQAWDATAEDDDERSPVATQAWDATAEDDDERAEEVTARAEEAEDARWGEEHPDRDRFVPVPAAVQEGADELAEEKDAVHHADDTAATDAERADSTRAGASEADEVDWAGSGRADPADAEVVDETIVAAGDDTDEPAAQAGPDEPVNAESLPGGVQAPPVGAFWADGAVDGLRERWRELQLRFIDDPRTVAGEADALVTEAVASVTRSLDEQRRRLAAWQQEPGDDTERLRAAVRGYRDFLDRLLGL